MRHSLLKTGLWVNQTCWQVRYWGVISRSESTRSRKRTHSDETWKARTPLGKAKSENAVNQHQGAELLYRFMEFSTTSNSMYFALIPSFLKLYIKCLYTLKLVCGIVIACWVGIGIVISFLNFIVVLSVAGVLAIMTEVLTGIGVGSIKVATDASASICCAK